MKLPLVVRAPVTSVPTAGVDPSGIVPLENVNSAVGLRRPVTRWRIVVIADRNHAAKVNKEDPGKRRGFFTGTTRLGTIEHSRLSS